MKRKSILLFLLSLFIFTSAAHAQTGQEAAEEVLLKRIRTMEGEIARLMREIETLRSEVERKRPANGPSAIPTSVVPPSEAPGATAAPQEKPGVDLGNGAKLIPYGTVYFNAFGNSSGTNNTDVPLWATATEGGNTGASLRQTRFGARIEGVRAGDAAVTAVVEADFYGGLPAVGLGENFGVVRLRVAKARFEWEKTSLSIGQDWIVFAPRNPVSIAAAAIPQFAASGNLWSRLPQVRAERKIDGGRFLIEGAVLSPASGDFPSGTESPFLLQPGAASRSLVPSFEGRFAFNGADWFGTKKSGSIAVSTHFGRADVSGTGISSYGIAADWNFPLARRIELSGELFVGENLGGLQGGIFQGYNPDFYEGTQGSAGTPRAIGTRGGWVQLSFTPPVLKDRLSLYGSVGIDDPDNADLSSRNPKNWRSRNLSYAFNVIYKPIPKLAIGGEFRRFETTYFLSGRRTAGHFNLGAAYNF